VYEIFFWSEHTATMFLVFFYVFSMNPENRYTTLRFNDVRACCLLVA
jgi:hypothetical protein